VTGPLAGLRVLDFTWFLAGPYATMILADLGADVVKVESPGRGDPSRQAGPFIAGLSAYFLSINRGKRSVVLDLKTEAGRAQAAQLAARADVLVENFVPGTMARWGLDYAALESAIPRLIYVSCTGFGQSGPRAPQPAFDLIVQALAGTISLTGAPDGEPVRAGFSVGDIGGALYLAIGVLAALEARHRTGRGQYLDLSLLDAQMALLENAFSRYFATGQVPGRLGSRHPLIVPFQVFAAADGHFALAAGTEEQWQRLCQALERPDLAADPRFAENAARRENLPALQRELAGAFGARSVAEWVALLGRHDIPCAPIHDIAAAAADPQVRARGMVATVDDPLAGPQRVVNTPLRFSETPAQVRATAPQLGQHTQAVLEEWLGS
jgi:crotonobetainyl-CoA:carnitine CoA-transferase CaiB-like acyl-CoA transferase